MLSFLLLPFHAGGEARRRALKGGVLLFQEIVEEMAKG